MSGRKQSRETLALLAGQQIGADAGDDERAKRRVATLNGKRHRCVWCGDFQTGGLLCRPCWNVLDADQRERVTAIKKVDVHRAARLSRGMLAEAYVAGRTQRVDRRVKQEEDAA